jgi:hypothetical protein
MRTHRTYCGSWKYRNCWNPCSTRGQGRLGTVVKTYVTCCNARQQDIVETVDDDTGDGDDVLAADPDKDAVGMLLALLISVGSHFISFAF